MRRVLYRYNFQTGLQDKLYETLDGSVSFVSKGNLILLSNSSSIYLINAENLSVREIHKFNIQVEEGSDFTFEIKEVYLDGSDKVSFNYTRGEILYKSFYVTFNGDLN